MNMVGAAIIVALFLAVCQADLNYTNDWAVRIDAGDDVANVIAAKHGFINMGQVTFRDPVRSGDSISDKQPYTFSRSAF